MATVLVRNRLPAVLSVVAAMIALVATLPPAARALPTGSPTDTVGLRGQVVFDLVVLDSGRVIVGGRFTEIGPFSRANLGAVLADGSADPDFAPTTNGDVRAIAVSEDGSRVFVGGTFTEVNGQPRHNLAALDATTGALVSGWRADTTGAKPMVSTLAVSGDRLLVGGRFSGIDGRHKEKLAAVDVTTGDFLRWSTWVNGAVNELRVTPDGATVWLGGEFTKVGGTPRRYVGGVDPVTGQLHAFDAQGNNSRLITLALSQDGKWLYTANNSNDVHAYKIGQAITPRWTNRGTGNTQAIVVTANKVYLGGHFKQFGEDGAPRVYFARLRRWTGELTGWNPRATGFHKGVWALAVHNGSLHASGGFTHFDGVKQRLFARFGGTA